MPATTDPRSATPEETLTTIEQAAAARDAARLLEIGIELDDLGRNDEAMIAFQCGAALDEPGCILLYGRGLEDRDDFNGPIAAYQHGVELQDSLSAYNLGLLLLNEENTARARELFSCSLDWGFGRAAYALNHLLDPEDEHDLVVATMRKAIALGEPQAAIILGDALREVGERADAMDAFRTGMNHAVPECFIELAAMQEEDGDVRAAVATLQQGVETCEVGNHFMQGRIYWLCGESAQAIAEYRCGVRADDGLCAVNLGYLLLRNGELVEAAEVLERGIELGAYESAINLALVRLEQGNLEGAEAALEIALLAGLGGTEVEQVYALVAEARESSSR